MLKDVTVKGAKESMGSLERDIYSLIHAFEESTGVHVKDVRIGTHHTNATGKRACSVGVETELTIH